MKKKIIKILYRFIAVERCSGTLKDYVSTINAKIHPSAALHQITSGLGFLHEKNICHRDIKPSNIFISPPVGSHAPRMKLGNYAYFRISKTEQPLYKLMGTKGWSAPEIFDSSQKTFTFAMDLFSLGLVFVYVLSGGIHPFGKEKEDRIVKVKKKEPMTFTLKQLVNVDGAEKVFDLI